MLRTSFNGTLYAACNKRPYVAYDGFLYAAYKYSYATGEYWFVPWKHSYVSYNTLYVVYYAPYAIHGTLYAARNKCSYVA